MGGLELEHHLDLNEQCLENQTNTTDEETRRSGGLELQMDLKDELQSLKKQINMQDEEIQRLKSRTDMQDEEIQRLKSQTNKQDEAQESFVNQLIDMEEKDRQHLKKRVNLLEKEVSKINAFINHRPPLPGAAAEEQTVIINKFVEEHLVEATPSVVSYEQTVIRDKFGEEYIVGATPSVAFDAETISGDMYGEKNVGTLSSEVQVGGGAPDGSRKSHTTSWFMGRSRELIVKQLRLSKALTVPDSTSIYEACRRMAIRRVDAILIADVNGLLGGILTHSDIAKRVIAQEINNLEETPVSKFMTRNPIFISADSLAVLALLQMVQGNFKQFPVVENGEVIAFLHMRKFFFDAFARMERGAEEREAIAAAFEKNWGTSTSGRSTFFEKIRELMFSSALSTVTPENQKIATVSLTETVSSVAKKMFEFQSSCAVVTVDHKPLGILTSRDIVMRVIVQNLPSHLTPVEKVMTPNPECATMNTSIVDALHIMHDGKFLHLPVVDRDGEVVAVVDVIHIITHAAVTILRQVSSTSEVNNDIASTAVQKLWDTALILNTSNEDEEKGRLEDLLSTICRILISG